MNWKIFVYSWSLAIIKGIWKAIMILNGGWVGSEPSFEMKGKKLPILHKKKLKKTLKSWLLFSLLFIVYFLFISAIFLYCFWHWYVKIFIHRFKKMNYYYFFLHIACLYASFFMLHFSELVCEPMYNMYVYVALNLNFILLLQRLCPRLRYIPRIYFFSFRFLVQFLSPVFDLD